MSHVGQHYIEFKAGEEWVPLRQATPSHFVMCNSDERPTPFTSHEEAVRFLENNGQIFMCGRENYRVVFPALSKKEKALLAAARKAYGYIGDQQGIREDGTLRHECELVTNPPKGGCDVCDMWADLTASIAAYGSEGAK